MLTKKVCIFVDGENLRFSICDLFPEFDKFNYLPKDAKWADFFDWIANEASSSAERIRAYWYVVKDIDFSPYGLHAAKSEPGRLEAMLCWDERNKRAIAAITDPQAKVTLVDSIVRDLEHQQQLMEKRFHGWITIQDTISSKHTAVEFRRAGSIRYDLFQKKLGSEKAVDVKLATDLIKLKDIYDIAIIVSGDQDYVPAVEAIKDYGKRVINVAFQKEDGRSLPGGAKRLGYATDWTIEVKHSDLKKFLGV